MSLSEFSKEGERIFEFILREKFICITVLGSIFTFAFISSFKEDIVDPIMYFILSPQSFDFMNVVIREGEKVEYPERQLEIRVGHFFRATVTWILLMLFLFALKCTNFPDIPQGNATGAAAL